MTVADAVAKEVMGVKVITPGKPKKSDTAYDRKKNGIHSDAEQVSNRSFGHLKTDHQACRITS